MSIIDPTLTFNKTERGTITDEPANIALTDADKEMRQDVISKFALGYTTMYTPRTEFNDLSTIARDQTDFLAWNTYQPNNGDPNDGDQINGWRSNAIRPIERNKAVSIAAHASSHLLFPEIEANNQSSDAQEDAAKVMRSLIEWVGEKNGYAFTALKAIIQALVAPASILHREYTQVYRPVKRDKVNGEYTKEMILDETLSGFIDTIVPVDQFFIENFFEQDVQKQGWLIWRRAQDHRQMRAKYGHLPNWKYVKPGMQLLYNDANQTFYWVYDPNMRRFMDEEVLYYEKERDLFLVYVNGIPMTEADNANPRYDKLYPFCKFGYEFIRNNCFYYKSLVFKVSHDANIINTLYPIIIDGSYLNVMPPFINIGGEIIGSDVIVPGGVTTLSSPNAQLNPIKMATDLKSGIDAMFKVEESINETSEIGQETNQGQGQMTAYEVSKRDEERQQQLGLFLQMIASFVYQYAKLGIGDILQHLTIADADQITDESDLVYKSFLIKIKESAGQSKYRKIMFDGTTGETNDALKESYKTLKMQGGMNSETELLRVHPENLQEVNFSIIVTPDVLSPRSSEIQRLFDLETYDRAIANPIADQEEIFKTFLLSTNPKSDRNQDKFISKNPGQGGQPPQQPPSGGASPINQITNPLALNATR
jgi:Bacteriophage head to tail connecting protein